MNPSTARLYPLHAHHKAGASAPLPALSDADLAALESLRERCARDGDGDRFDERVLAHLRFIRWLVRSRRLTP